MAFRRTSPQIRNQGGLWDESAKLYPLLGATPHESVLEWDFPGGARLKMAHLQHESNKYDWQGSQVPLILWDELTHFSETQFFYMLTRNRSTCGVRPYTRATTNPDADSWVAKLIAWWINQETGYAIAERSGVVRWFVRVNEELVWADTAEELLARFPKMRPKSLTFIPANLDDNKILLEKDPGYLANLMAQPLVERERLLGGNWKIRPTAGRIFNRGWFETVQAVPAGGVECRFWDFSGTAKELAKDDPDYTAGVRIRAVNGEYYVTDCIAAQAGPAEVERLFINTTKQDAEAAKAAGAAFRVRWEVEPGSAGKREALRLIQLLAGFDARGVPSQGDKFARSKPFAVQCEAGNVKLLAGAWNEAWLSHMHNQPEIAHDDIMDASGGSFNDLVQGGGFRIR